MSTYRLEHITLTMTMEGRQLQSAFKSWGNWRKNYLARLKSLTENMTVLMCLICLYKHNASVLYKVSVILP